MLTTDKILAHKTNGKNLILLTQVASSYFLVFGQIVAGRKGSSYKAIYQKELSREEAALAHAQLTGTPRQTMFLSETTDSSATGAKVSHADIDTAEQIILLLDSPKASSEAVPAVISHKPVQSPYFPTKDIFLASQMTCAPNALQK